MSLKWPFLSVSDTTDGLSGSPVRVRRAHRRRRRFLPAVKATQVSAVLMIVARSTQ